MTGPFALKILSPDISHKSDVGGAALNLEDAHAVREAAEAMASRVAAVAPKARLEGFIVQPMAIRPHGRELIVGMSVDKVFGRWCCSDRAASASRCWPTGPWACRR